MSEEKITSLVKMPNEENVDTSGLSFTNCIQNRFFSLLFVTTTITMQIDIWAEIMA